MSDSATADALRLSVRTGPREPRFPHDDDALGLVVWGMVADAVGRRAAPPAVFLFTEREAHLVDLRPVVKDRAQAHRRIAGFAGMEGVEALGLVGVLVRRKRGMPTWRYAVAFLEWPDGRWWLGHRRVMEDGTFSPLFDVEVQRAVDGAALPGGLGGWFRRARIEGLRATMWAEGDEN